MEDRISTDRMERLLGSELSRLDDPRDGAPDARRLAEAAPPQPRIHKPRPDLGPDLGDEAVRYDEAFRKTELRLAETHEQDEAGAPAGRPASGPRSKDTRRPAGW